MDKRDIGGRCIDVHFVKKQTRVTAADTFDWGQDDGCVGVCWSVLECVGVCRVLQCVAVCCSVLQCVAVFAVCCSVLQCVALC